MTSKTHSNQMFPFRLICWVALISFFLPSCKDFRWDTILSGPSDANARIAYFDGTSVFIHDLRSDSSFHLFDPPNTDNIVIIKALDDSTILCGYRGPLIDSVFDAETGENLDESEVDYYVFTGIVGSDTEIQFEYYAVTYQAIDVETGFQWHYKTVEHRGFANDAVLKFRTKTYDRAGNLVSTRDSITDCYGKSQMDWVNYCDPLDHFETYSEIHQGHQIHCEDGNLSLIEDGREELILKDDQTIFNFRFGNGFVEAALSPDGTYTTYRLLSGMENYGSPCGVRALDKGLYEMNLDTRETITVVEENGWHPSYSPGGGYLLFGRETEKCLDNYRVISDVMILDRSTWTTKSIGRGINFFWLHK